MPNSRLYLRKVIFARKNFSKCTSAKLRLRVEIWKIVAGKIGSRPWKNPQNGKWRLLNHLSFFWIKKKNCIGPVITPTLRERLLILSRSLFQCRGHQSVKSVTGTFLPRKVSRALFGCHGHFSQKCHGLPKKYHGGKNTEMNRHYII